MSKFGLGFWLPLALLYYLFKFPNLYINGIIIIFCNVIFLLFYVSAKNKTWWDVLCNTHKSYVYKKNLFVFPAFLFSIVLLFFILQIYNNVGNRGVDKILGFKFPFKRIEYPDNRKVQSYYKFLKEKGQNPKDYLLNLFDTYDIVVLCENLHPEDTQWDFIYDVVSDKRFYEKAGNIFTEYGCVRDHAKVDTFMQTNFNSEIELQKATATLMNYHSGNFYYFMKKLYKLNSSLPDSLKIKEHFTDVLGWKYLYFAYNDSINFDYGNPYDVKRDSLMAQVVIDWYNKERKKCLVVTNFRHAFIVKNKELYGNYSDNEAQYIYNSHPTQTVNIMLYGSAYNIMMFKPVSDGIWNTALQKTDYKPVGFSFENSPFGQDFFDKFPYFFKSYPYTYSNIFTGFVFYKPEEQFRYSKQPFKKYAAQKEYKFAVQNNLIDTIKGKQLLNNYKDEFKPLENISFFSLYLSFYHYADILIWFIWGVIVAVILILFNTVGCLNKKQ
ncbi:MAG: hypothetical protein LBS50_00295 [Prevotellaceae bacterium]|nr:hypothetical protein [Prevotellaceae bacterium]